VARFNLALSALVIAVGGAALAGCNDVTRFSTAADESFCGSIVPGPFVRQGFGPGVRMRLTFDADRLSDRPGVISTDDGLLDRAALRPIPQLANDPLSSLQFGEGRMRNLLLGVSPTEGPNAFAVVSLMENGNIEVRVIRGAPLPPGVTAYPVESGTQLFGVFPLARQKGQCGF
jgi:hypothetical protein